MKRFGYSFGLVLILALLLALPSQALAQGAQVRPSLKAGVMQRLGADTDITITYSRPGVKGRKIWGALVPFGMAPGNQYSKNQPFPWRAGANENTTIEFSKDVLIEGKPLEPAFDGHSNCFIESGKRKAILLDFNYDVEPLPGRFPFARLGPMPLLKPSWINHVGKAAFRWIYWHILLPGRPIPFVPAKMKMAGKKRPVESADAGGGASSGGAGAAPGNTK